MRTRVSGPGPFLSLAVSALLVACGHGAAPAPDTRAETAATTTPTTGGATTEASALPGAATAASPVAPSPAPSTTAATATAHTAEPTHTASTHAGAPGAAPGPTAAPSALAAASAAPTATPAALPEVSSPKTAEANFAVWMSGAGRYKAGEAGAVQVVLTARNGFHCNPNYPYKLKLSAAPAGVTFPQPVVRKDGMSIAPERAVMPVPFVAGAAGEARIAGTFSFSVCSEATCQIESREVALTVKVE